MDTLKRGCRVSRLEHNRNGEIRLGTNMVHTIIEDINIRVLI